MKEWILLNTTSSRMITRVKSIYMYIYHQGIVTTHELAEEFGITSRTIQRDLHILVFNGLIYSPKKGKWKKTTKKVKITS